MAANPERRGRDRRKPGSPSSGGRRRGLRRLRDRQRILEDKLLKLRKDIDKLAGPAVRRPKGRGWGKARPEAGHRTFRREPVIKSGLNEPPVSKRRWMSLA